MVFIFQFKSEPLGILQNQTIKKIIEDALFQVPDETEENPPSVSTATPTIDKLITLH